MSDFSFSYEKKIDTYFIYVSLKKRLFGIRISADKNKWEVTAIGPSESHAHPHKRRINRCLVQYALYKISQNDKLKKELIEFTAIPSVYKNVLENPYNKPYILSSGFQPGSFTEKCALFFLECKVFYGSVEEEIKVVYYATNEGYKFSHLLRELAFKDLEKEGFPFHTLTDEEIIFSLKENEEIQQYVSKYVPFVQHLLAIKQHCSEFSFTINECIKEHEFQQFEFQLKEFPLELSAGFAKNKLNAIGFEMNTGEDKFRFLSNDESMFPSLYKELYEFITKKSKYRTRFLF